MEDGLWGIDVRIRPLEGERVISGCYRVVQPLKPGPGWETLLAIDLAQGDRVVVKTISAEGISAGGVAQLEHDAEALRRVRGPWVTGLRRLGREDDLLFFVTPYIPGVSLQERLAEEPLSAAETLIVGRCLLAGLHEVHGLGALHRAISRLPNRDGSMPAARQYFLTSRQGVLRSRCRRSSPVPSGLMGRKSGPSLSSPIPARET